MRAPAEKFLIDAYQASQIWPVQMERSAYDEMIASGMAKSFGDVDIRRRLSAYYAAMPSFQATAVGTTTYRERIRREMKFAVQNRIRERCNDVFTRSSPDGLLFATLPERCVLDLGPELISPAAARLAATPDLEEDLTRHIGDLDQKLGLFDRWLRQAREMREKLERKGE